MADQWYIRKDERAIGPFTVAQIKAQAASSRITPDTHLRKGRSGHWVPASRVKGLLSPDQLKHSKPAAKQPQAKPTVAAATMDEDEGTYLSPLRNRRRRLIVYLCLIAFILIGTPPWYQLLLIMVTVGLLCGSYPVVLVTKETIEQTVFVFFYPVHHKTWQLRDFVGVETDVEKRITESVGILVLFVWSIWLLFRIFDHVVPWLGGDYKLLLRRYDNERMQIWQGNNPHHYEANLRLFESMGLPIG